MTRFTIAVTLAMALLTTLGCEQLQQVLVSSPAAAEGVKSLSQSEMADGLKEMLSKSVNAAVGKLSQENGFLNNPNVKIPLPEGLKKVEDTLRKFGMNKQTDELVTTINRAAEAAVPQAKPVLLDAIKNMKWEDMKAIVNGGGDAATSYFKRTTKDPLTQKFLPLVQNSTQKVGLAKVYNSVAGPATKMGLIDPKLANIESYVTDKTMDGLFTMMGEEEKAIRANPAQYGSKLIGALFAPAK